MADPLRLPRIVSLAAIRDQQQAVAAAFDETQIDPVELLQAQRLTSVLTAIVRDDPDLAELELAELPADVVERLGDAGETLSAIAAMCLAGRPT